MADVDSIPRALALNGQKLLGVPLIIANSQSEKNYAALASKAA